MYAACMISVPHSSSSPGEEPGASADIRELHLQLLPGCSSQLFLLPGPDAGLFPSTSGEPSHRGPSGSRCPGPGSPGRPVGAGLPGDLHTVRRRCLWVWKYFPGRMERRLKCDLCCCVVTAVTSGPGEKNPDHPAIFHINLESSQSTTGLDT